MAGRSPKSRRARRAPGPGTARRPRCPAGPGRSASTGAVERGRRVGQVAHLGPQPGALGDLERLAKTPACRPLTGGRGRRRRRRSGSTRRRPAPRRRPRPWRPRRTGRASRRGCAAAGQAGVGLEVQPGGTPGGAAPRPRPRRAGPRRRPRGRRRRRPPGARSSPGACSQASSGTSMPAARSARASSRKATPSQAAPPATRGAGARQQAVAVAVRLDDRHDLRAAGSALGERATLSRTASRSTRASVRRLMPSSVPGAARTAAGQASSTARLTSPRPPRPGAGTAVQVRAPRGRVERREPLARSAPQPPGKTSPVPAVASAGEPVVLTRTARPGRPRPSRRP